MSQRVARDCDTLRLELSRVRARFGYVDGFDDSITTGWLPMAYCIVAFVISCLAVAVSVSVSAAASSSSSLGFWISVSSESYFSCAIAACHLVASPAAFPFHCTGKLLQQRKRERERVCERERVRQHTHAQRALSGNTQCQCLFIYHELHRIFRPLPPTLCPSLSHTLPLPLFRALWPDILSLSLGCTRS